MSVQLRTPIHLANYSVVVYEAWFHEKIISQEANIDGTWTIGRFDFAFPPTYAKTGVLPTFASRCIFKLLLITTGLGKVNLRLQFTSPTLVSLNNKNTIPGLRCCFVTCGPGSHCSVGGRNSLFWDRWESYLEWGELEGGEVKVSGVDFLMIAHPWLDRDRDNPEHEGNSGWHRWRVFWIFWVIDVKVEFFLDLWTKRGETKAEKKQTGWLICLRDYRWLYTYTTLCSMEY